ncbi:MAG: PAC2 family protein [Candidatus Thermoplasmatota archaeon]|nr:PAC2 family protein [Candidatus Thermoplasmatota archaeon]
MIEIEIKNFKDIDLENGTILEGFPSVGLVSSIVATHLIDLLKLDQICALDSEMFPSTSMIYAKKPKYPARIYASSTHKLGVFLAEFTPSKELNRPIAKKLLQWCTEQKCQRIIAIEGLPIKSECRQDKNKNVIETTVRGIGSTDKTRTLLNKLKIEQLETGMVYGVAGVLLNEGRWNNFDVIALLADACPDIPDAYAAAKILETLNLLLPDIKLESTPLYEQAKKYEQQIKALRKQAEPFQPEPYKDMYI